MPRDRRRFIKLSGAALVATALRGESEPVTRKIGIAHWDRVSTVASRGGTSVAQVQCKRIMVARV